MGPRGADCAPWGVYNPLRMRPSAERAVIGIVLAISLLMLGLQAIV